MTTYTYRAIDQDTGMEQTFRSDINPATTSDRERGLEAMEGLKHQAIDSTGFDWFDVYFGEEWMSSSEL